MQYYQENPSKLPYICIVWSPQMGNLMTVEQPTTNNPRSNSHTVQQTAPLSAAQIQS